MVSPYAEGSCRASTVNQGEVHVFPQNTLPMVQPSDQSVRERLVQAPGPRPGPVCLRHVLGPVLWPVGCRRGLGPYPGPVRQHAPPASARVLPAGPAQSRPTSPPPRCDRLLLAAVALGVAGLEGSTAGSGPGPDQPWRPLHRPDDQCRLPRLGYPHRLEGAAWQPPGGLEPALAATVAAGPWVFRPGLPGAGPGRPGPGIAEPVPHHQGFGLASAAARQGGRLFPPTRLGQVLPDGPLRPRRGLSLEGCRRGLQDSHAAAGVYVAGLLGGRARRTVAGADRPAAAVGRAALVRPAQLDRAGIQNLQARGLAVAADAHDRSGARDTAVVGAGGGHTVRGQVGHVGRRSHAQTTAAAATVRRDRQGATATPHLRGRLGDTAGAVGEGQIPARRTVAPGEVAQNQPSDRSPYGGDVALKPYP